MVKRTPINRIKMCYGRFRPNDNSYSFCYEDRKKYHLAGTRWSEGETVEMISKPFDEYVTPREIGIPNHLGSWHTFVKVRCKRGLTHRVLWAKHREV